MQKNKSIVSARSFTREFLESFFKDTERLIKKEINLKGTCEGKVVALLFYEPSTRTRISFELAARYLGCEVIGFSSEEATSVAKGENLVDTLRMYEGYGVDAIVLRHPKAGAAEVARRKLEVPVINAGDGSHEHPTQALIDCFTIWEEFRKKIDGLYIGILGDLRYGRTVSSLSYALSNYDVEIYFIAPELLQIDKRQDGMEKFLQERDVKYKICSDLSNLGNCDILYVTRIQKERFPDPSEYEKVRGSYTINLKILENAKKGLKVMHPLPRVDEIHPEVDNTEYALYFKQASCGLPVRVVLLWRVLSC